ncbi:MAG: M23 family metallopeptidase [Myxococcota bacterium]
MALLLVVNYFVFFRADQPTNGPSERIAAVGVAPESSASRAARGDGSEPFDGVDDFGQPVGRKVTGEIKRGQTILNALRAVGIDSHTAQPIIAAMSEVFDFRKAQVGDTFTAHIDDDGQVTYFSYAQSPLDVYEVVRTPDGEHQAKKKKIPTRIDVAHIGCAIKSSLYESIARCGEGTELAGALIELFAWDVDFFQDVRDGDEFKVIVEKISVDGRFLRYGNILAAQYKGKFGDHKIVSYTDPDGREGYYKPDGHAVRKEFIKSPLKYSKVSADATTPQGGVKMLVKTASPVVYTAKANTPVWAVASGTVVFAGDSGGALGKTVTIKHENGFTSSYAHLSSVATGIAVGTLVKQKTVIGKVGKTGDADGPQLTYSLKKDGRYVNPLKMSYSEGDPVAPEHKSHFETEVEQILEDLDHTPVIGVQERRG